MTIESARQSRARGCYWAGDMSLRSQRAIRRFIVHFFVVMLGLLRQTHAAEAGGDEDTVEQDVGPDTEQQIRDALSRGKRMKFRGTPGAVRAEFLKEQLTARPVGGELSPLRLSHVRILGDVELRRAEIARFVELDHVRVEGVFRCTDCQFQQRFALFRGSEVLPSARRAEALSLAGSRFQDMLELQYARVEGHVDLAGIEVKRTLYLDAMKVEGGLDLSRVRAATLQAYALVLPACGSCRFTAPGMGIAGDVLLIDARIETPFTLEGSRIAGDLMLRGAKFRERPCLSAVHVDGCLNINGTHFPQGADLSDLEFARLVTLPASGERAATDGNTWEEVLEQLLRVSPFRAEVYARAEAYFKNRGEPDLADAVYIEQRSQERIRQLEGTTAATSWLQETLVGYGRRPYLALLWSLLFVAIGVRVFPETAMVLKEPTHATPKYSAFWYSLDVFLPLTHLRAGELWSPKPAARWRWLYLRIHHLLGWILIPLGIAAVSGLVK